MLRTTRGRSTETSPAGSPSRASRPPWVMLATMSLSASGWPDISSPTSKPSFMPSVPLHLGEGRRTGVDGERHAGRAGQLEPVVADVGDDDVAGAGMSHDRCRHDADRAGAGDEDVLAEHPELQGRVHGIAEGVEDRGDVEVDLVGVPPGVHRGQGDVLGEGAVALDADADGVGAQVPAAGQAVAAPAADDVALAADEVADVDVGDRCARPRPPRRRTRGRGPPAS